MSVLQKQPQGLLGALDLKTLGQQPVKFSDTLTPTFETSDHYLMLNRTAITGAGPWVALGTAIALVGDAFIVPAESTWRVKGLSVVCGRAGADIALTLEFIVALRRAGKNFDVALFTPRFEPTVATDLLQARAFWLPRTVLMGPGDQFRLVPRSTQTAAGSSIGLSADLDVFQSS